MKNITILGEDTAVMHQIQSYISMYVDRVSLCSFGNGSAYHVLSSSFPDILCIDVDSIMGFSPAYFLELSQKSNIMLLFLLTTQDMSMLDTLLSIGNSDYILKPYHPGEIIVRANRLLLEKGTSMQLHTHTEIVPNVLFDEMNALLIMEGSSIYLPKTVKMLLSILVEHKDRLVPHQYIYEKIWGDHAGIHTQRDIRAHIRRLRSILGTYGEHIINIKAQGYMLKTTQW